MKAAQAELDANPAEKKKFLERAQKRLDNLKAGVRYTKTKEQSLTTSDFVEETLGMPKLWFFRSDVYASVYKKNPSASGHSTKTVQGIVGVVVPEGHLPPNFNTNVDADI